MADLELRSTCRNGGGDTDVVLATNLPRTGAPTEKYMGARLRARGLTGTRLARGVPVGSELEYVDPSTVAQAMRDRRSVE